VKNAQGVLSKLVAPKLGFMVSPESKQMVSNQNGKSLIKTALIKGTIWTFNSTTQPIGIITDKIIIAEINEIIWNINNR
jgi:hypothetical protein